MCKQLLKRKRDVEKELSHEVTKRRKVEQSAQLKELKTLQAQNIHSDGARRGSSSKSWESYGRQQRGNISERLSSEITSALSTCSNEHFEPISVELMNTSGKKF